jgi:hypothetical protein
VTGYTDMYNMWWGRGCKLEVNNDIKGLIWYKRDDFCKIMISAKAA